MYTVYTHPPGTIFENIFINPSSIRIQFLNGIPLPTFVHCILTQSNLIRQQKPYNSHGALVWWYYRNYRRTILYILLPTYNLGEYRNSVTFLCFAAIVYTNPWITQKHTHTPTPLSQSRATCTCALTHFTLGKSIPASKIHHHYPYNIREHFQC